MNYMNVSFENDFSSSKNYTLIIGITPVTLLHENRNFSPCCVV